jgi:hypothetical protein
MAQRSSFAQAALAISQAKALVISAGAGMGVDSGLPDFRARLYRQTVPHAGFAILRSWIERWRARPDRSFHARA